MSEDILNVWFEDEFIKPLSVPMHVKDIYRKAWQAMAGNDKRIFNQCYVYNDRQKALSILYDYVEKMVSMERLIADIEKYNKDKNVTYQKELVWLA